MSKIILPNDQEIEFHIAPLPVGGYGVSCGVCGQTVRFPHFVSVLKWQKEHRAEHFGTLRKLLE